MSERPVEKQARETKVGTEIEFFVAREFARTVIFESLILEFVTRLRERRRTGSESCERRPSGAE